MKMSDAEYAEWRAAIAADREGRAMSDALRTEVPKAFRDKPQDWYDHLARCVDCSRFHAHPEGKGRRQLLDARKEAERAVVSAAERWRNVWVNPESSAHEVAQAENALRARVDALLSLRGEDA